MIGIRKIEIKKTLSNITGPKLLFFFTYCVFLLYVYMTKLCFTSQGLRTSVFLIDWKAVLTMFYSNLEIYYKNM